MLLGSSQQTAAYLTQTQSRTMFSMWCVMTAPLLIGSNIRNLSDWDLITYNNTEVIAVNQDPLGVQGIRLVGGDMKVSTEFFAPSASTTNVWGKPLKGGDWAVIFLNNANSATVITCDSNCFKQMGFKPTDTLNIHDLWKHQDIGTTTANTYSIHVPGKGGSTTVRFSKQTKV